MSDMLACFCTYVFLSFCAFALGLLECFDILVCLLPRVIDVVVPVCLEAQRSRVPACFA